MGTPDLESLKSTLVNNNAHAGWCTVAVFVGLVVEYTVLLWPKWKELKTWERVFTILAGFAIAGGVYGEYLFGSKAADAALQIENISENRVAGLNKEAGDARNAAESAKATAKAFESQIADANARAKAAEAQVASANAASRDAVAKVSSAEARIAQATARAAEATQKAEAERLERLKLEAVVAPRSLSLDQQRQIADACRKFTGHGVLVKSYGTDGEGAALAGQIIAALEAAGVVVADSRGAEMVVGEFDSGVHVRAPITEISFAYTIADALSTIGKLEVAPVNDPEPKIGAAMTGGGQTFSNPIAVFVTLRVGIKPQPTLPAK